MNQEKQRIAIAEACGWRHKERVFEAGVQIKLGGWYDPDGYFYGEHTSDLPNYLNSLDDMHEAEERMGALEPGARRRYAELLRDWLGADGSVFATAAQRAEALLKTLSLWSD